MHWGILAVVVFAVAIAWAEFKGLRRVCKLLWYVAAGTVFLIGLVL